MGLPVGAGNDDKVEAGNDDKVEAGNDDKVEAGNDDKVEAGNDDSHPRPDRGSTPSADLEEYAPSAPHSDRREHHRRYMIQITERKEKVHRCNRLRIPTGIEKEYRLQHTGNHYDRDPAYLQDANGQWMTHWRCAYARTY